VIWSRIKLLTRYYHTLRYLKWIQYTGRIRSAIHRPRPPQLVTPPVRDFVAANWSSCPLRPASMHGPKTFRFLNVSASLQSANDWKDSTQSQLWLYNLHYFDDLTAQDHATRTSWHRDLISQWIRENPAALGAGWAPYPTSLRIVNWVKWAFAGNTLDSTAQCSLAKQTQYLSQTLEYKFLGNHLWANAKALIFSGVFFQGTRSDAWLYRGIKLIETQLGEQILDDGGHFELSPMYHAIILEDVLDIINLSQFSPGAIPGELITRMRVIATRMLNWLRMMTHPDGGISFFNDSTFAIAPAYGALACYAVSLGIIESLEPIRPIEHLKISGYVRLTTAVGVLFIDVARVGPDYLPAHAHADTLSFEFSILNQRIFVNGGISTYSLGAVRQLERGTASHNTVDIDGEDSSEVWGAFRVARRATPFHVKAERIGDRLCVEGSHDGYRRLKGKPVHTRRIEMTDTSFVVCDRIEGGHGQSVQSHLLVHPGCLVTQVGSTVRIETDQCEVTITSSAPFQIEDAHWATEFGRTMQTSKICFDYGACPTQVAVEIFYQLK
jgi:uncharacterized heparinase superfamily protein